MNKAKLLLFLICSFLFIACDSDVTKEEPSECLIDGSRITPFLQGTSAFDALDKYTFLLCTRTGGARTLMDDIEAFRSSAGYQAWREVWYREKKAAVGLGSGLCRARSGAYEPCFHVIFGKKAGAAGVVRAIEELDGLMTAFSEKSYLVEFRICEGIYFLSPLTGENLDGGTPAG